jgi:mono/diheme cytochrome c family protein
MHAETKGSDAPDTVHIVGTPTWTNGVAELVALKCAVCHAQPLPDISPHNTPHDLDLRQQSAQGTLRGADEIAAFVSAGILRQDLTGYPRMSPPYGTPVVAEERTALETWANAVVPPDVHNDTSPASGAILFTFHCQGCHGVNGRGATNADVQGQDAAIIQAAIDTNVPQMHTWPGLSSLSPNEVQAIAHFLQQF